MNRKFFSMTLALFTITNCVTSPKVVDTQAYKGKTLAEREQAYKDNSITTGGMFKPYKVGESPYPAEQLSPLFEAPYTSEAAKSKYSSGNTYNTIATIFGAAGGFMVGWNAGTALGGGQANSGLWIGGGASLVVAFIFGSVADGKYTAASNMYNNDLQRALDLRQKTSAVKPQEQFAHYTVGMAQAF